MDPHEPLDTLSLDDDGIITNAQQRPDSPVPVVGKSAHELLDSGYQAAFIRIRFDLMRLALPTQGLVEGRRCVRCPSHDRPDRSGIVSPPGDKRLRLLLPTGEPV